MPRSREACSKTRSRPRQDCAYSPTGSSGVVLGRARATPGGHERVHVAGREDDDARAARSAAPRCAGTIAFWAQVRSGRSARAELAARQEEHVRRPSGSRATCAGSRRSQEIGLDPVLGQRASASPGSEKRDDRHHAPRARPPRRRRGARGGRATAPSCRPRPARSRRPRASARTSTSAADGPREQLLELRPRLDRAGPGRTRAAHGGSWPDGNERGVAPAPVRRGGNHAAIAAARRSLVSLCGRLSPARSLPRWRSRPPPGLAGRPVVGLPSSTKSSSWEKPSP